MPIVGNKSWELAWELCLKMGSKCRFLVLISENLFRLKTTKNVLNALKSSIQDVSQWRRKRDLNPRDPFEPYSLSRGAPSPLGYFSSMVNAISLGMLAERVGFEPTVHCCITSFQDWLLKPLGHLSFRIQLYHYSIKSADCQELIENFLKKLFFIR